MHFYSSEILLPVHKSGPDAKFEKPGELYPMKSIIAVYFSFTMEWLWPKLLWQTVTRQVDEYEGVLKRVAESKHAIVLQLQGADNLYGKVPGISLLSHYYCLA